MKINRKLNKKKYEKPCLRIIELLSKEVMGFGDCVNVNGSPSFSDVNGCNTGDCSNP